MIPPTPGQRVFFAVICAAALLVAVLGLFAPQSLAEIFTWLVLPPLHARFVGAIYLFGAVFMVGCLLARRQAEVRWAVPMIGIWTGMLLLISLLNLEVFDFALLPVWIWFASYIIYPLVAAWMTWRLSRQSPTEKLPERNLPGWANGILWWQGLLVSLLAVLLFFMPGGMAVVWPWKVTPVLAQMYAGPLLSYGVGSLLYSRQNRWSEIRPVVPAMLVFTAATLVVSAMHRSLFTFSELADWLWFLFFASGTAALGALSFRSLRERE